MQWIEAITLGGILAAVVHVIFSSSLTHIYLLLPPMLWVALRFGVFGIALATTLLAGMACYYTAVGLGPYAAISYTREQNILLMQSFLVVAGVGALLLVAMIIRQRSAQQEWQCERDELETRVAARTAALRESEEKLHEIDERFRIARTAAKIIVLDWDMRRDEHMFSESPVWLRGPLPTDGGKYPLFKDQVHEDDRAHFLAMRQLATDTLEAQTLQFRIVRTDGVVLHIQSYQTVLPGPDGKAARMIAVHQDISAHKQMETALAENQRQLSKSESRYRTLFINNPLMYFTIDAAGVIASVNPQGATQLGYSVAELVGQPVMALFPPYLHDRVYAQLSQCRRAPERVHTWEITKLHKNGETMWVHETAVAVQDGNHSPLLLIMCENVTERTRAEIALRESEQRLRTLLDAIPDHVRLKDADGRYVMVNRAAQESFGLPEDQIIGKTVFDLRPAVAAAVIDAEDRQASAASGPIRIERRSYMERNTWREEILAPIRDAGGAVTGLVSISRDITERKQAELQALREREQRYRTLVEQASDIIYRTDPKGFFTFLNTDAASRMLGYSREDLLGHHYLEFVHADYRAETEKFYRSQFRERRPTSYYEFPAIAKDGRMVWVGQHVQVITENNRIVYHQAVCRNISERVAVQQALRESNDKLRQISALQEGLLEAERTRIAHDLHDGIGQSLNLARIKIGAVVDEARGGKFDMTLREVTHIIDLTISAIRTLEFDLSPPVLRELGLGPALEWLAEEMQREYALQVGISDDGEPKPLDGLCRTVVFRAVRELLINIVRHAGVASAHVDMQRTGDRLIITVSDEGVGFDATATARGLGLVSVRERLSYIGGNAAIVGAPGEGTLATLSLPLSADNAVENAT